jgi:hypothetical protein
MTDFNDWYAQQNPDLDPRLDDFHQEARKAYEAGAASQATADVAKSATLDELRAMRESGAIKPARDDAPEVDVPEGFWELSRDDRIKWGGHLALARKCADDSALQATGGLASDKTLRDEFAGQAMAVSTLDAAAYPDAVAIISYRLADAMLKARKTTGETKP